MRPSAELDEVREQLQEAAGALGRELAQLRAPLGRGRSGEKPDELVAGGTAWR